MNISVHFTSNSHLLTDEMILLKTASGGISVFTLGGDAGNHNKIYVREGGTHRRSRHPDDVPPAREAELPDRITDGYTAENISASEIIEDNLVDGVKPCRCFRGEVCRDGDNRR